MNRTDLERFCHNLDWNLLHTFLVIVEERGVTRAAKRLLVTQPAVTNALKRLETQFDCALIDRGENEFTLTKAGQLLYEECQEVYSGVSRMAELLKDVREEVTGHVSIAAATHCRSPVIDAALAQFHRENPKATLSIQVVTSGDVVTLVKRKTASCGFALTTASAAGLVSDVIFRSHFSLYCGRECELFGRDDITLEDVIAQPYVTYPTDQPGSEMARLTRARQEINFDKPPVGRSYHLEELVRMVEIGLGIGPFPVHVAQPLVDEGRLWRLPCFEELPVFDISLVTNPKTRRNGAESAFIKILLDEIAKTPIEERSYLS